MESAEYPHTMGPTLGTNFCHGFLPSPSLGDDWSTGPMVLSIVNSEMAAVVEVVFIYTRADLEGTPNMNKKAKKEGREGKGLYNKQGQSQICINNGCKIGHASLLSLRYTLDYKQEQVKLYL